MNIQISKSAADAMVDSIEFAISQLESNYHDDIWYLLHGNQALVSTRRAIEDLQMIRVTYMLAARKAAAAEATQSTATARANTVRMLREQSKLHSAHRA